MSDKAVVMKVGTDVDGTLQGFEFDGAGLGVVGLDYSHEPPLICGYTEDELRAMTIRGEWER